MLFRSRRERGCGNRIVFEASNLQCASLQSKLAMQAMVDRGAMTPNEWRAVMNMACPDHYYEKVLIPSGRTLKDFLK